MKKGIIFSIIATMVAAIGLTTLVACNGSDLSGYVAIDINPSVEFVTNKNGKVTAVRAANEDAAILISDLNLVGKNLDDAVEIITESSEEVGYINKDNVDVTITVGATDKKAERKLEKKARKGVERGSKMAVIRDDENAEALKAEVDALKAENPETYKDLTVAKLKLAKSLAEYDKTFTPAMAAKMRTDDLVELLHDFIDDYKDMIGDQMEYEFDLLMSELAESIYARIDAFYGEEYAAKAAIMRKLELLEDKFEMALESAEQKTVMDEIHDELFDDDDDDDDEDEVLTAEMIAEITAVIGEHTMRTLDHLDDYIDELEDWLENVERATVLTAEQKAEMAAIRQELKDVKQHAREQFSGRMEELKEQLKELKRQKMHG